MPSRARILPDTDDAAQLEIYSRRTSNLRFTGRRNSFATLSFNLGSMRAIQSPLDNTPQGYKNKSRKKRMKRLSHQASANIEPSNRKAVAVDSGTKAGNLRRLKRLEGQIRGLHKMVEEDRYCPDIMIQISAAQEALRTVGRELMRNHLKHCVSSAIRAGSSEQADATYAELLELIYKHSR